MSALAEQEALRKIDSSRLPVHIAVIMDGNGRWAKKRGLPRVSGHRAGMKTVSDIVEACRDLGIKVLTLYAFSTENWKRPRPEVVFLMKLLRQYLGKELERMVKNNIKLSTIGDISRLPGAVQKEMERVKQLTLKNDGMILNLALNYGSRREIVDAVKKICAAGAENIDEKSFGGYLHTGGLPDPDLLIRTSGELRISNFLLWQAAYAELYFTDTLWPDFSKDCLYEAVLDYQKRERRYGGL